MNRKQILRRCDPLQASSVGKEASRLKHDREASEDVPPCLIFLRRRPSTPSRYPLLDTRIGLLHDLHRMLD